MNQLRYHLLLATAAIAPLITAWLANGWFDSNHWLLRISLLSIALVVAGVSASLMMARIARDQLAVQHYLQLLCRTTSSDLAEMTPANDRSLGRCAVSWTDLLTQLHEQVQASAEDLQDSELLRASQEVRLRRHTQQQNRFATIIDGLNEPILAVNEYDELTVANPSALDLFSFTLGDGTPTKLGEQVRCEDLIELLQATRRRRSSSTRVSEVELAAADGTPQHFQITAKPLPTNTSDDENAPRGAVAVLRNIGALKQLQQRNAEFVSSVSHEMKTPLAGIKAYVELLEDGDAEDQETQDEFLGIISAQADRLQRLIDNLLNLARIEAGVVKVSKESRSLNEVLQEALGVVQHLAEAKQIRCTSDLSPLYLGVLADRDMLLQSAINLLSNAIKYTPDGGEVTLRSRSEGEHEVLFEVQDTGVGLSEEDQEMVFGKFYRVSKDKTMASGTGLGLPLAKHIVEDVHGGRLSVTSTLGEGSTFSVHLPAAGQLTTATSSS